MTVDEIEIAVLEHTGDITFAEEAGNMLRAHGITHTDFQYIEQ